MQNTLLPLLFCFCLATGFFAFHLPGNDQQQPPLARQKNKVETHPSEKVDSCAEKITKQVQLYELLIYGEPEKVKIQIEVSKNQENEIDKIISEYNTLILESLEHSEIFRVHGADYYHGAPFFRWSEFFSVEIQGKYPIKIVKELTMKCKKLFGNHHPIVGIFYNALGVIYNKSWLQNSSQTNMTDSCQYYLDKALEVKREAAESNPSLLGITYENLAIEARGEKQTAFMKKTVPLYEKGKNYKRLCKMLSYLANRNVHNNKLEEAIALSKRRYNLSLGVAGFSDYQILALLDLGRQHQRLGDFINAIHYYSLALDLNDNTNFSNYNDEVLREREIILQLNIGSCWLAMGDLIKSEAAFSQANDLNSLRTPRFLDNALSENYLNRAKIALQRDDTQKAIQYLNRRNLELKDISNLSSFFTLLEMGKVKELGGNDSEAIKYFLQASDLIEEMRNKQSIHAIHTSRKLSEIYLKSDLEKSEHYLSLTQKVMDDHLDSLKTTDSLRLQRDFLATKLKFLLKKHEAKPQPDSLVQTLNTIVEVQEQLNILFSGSLSKDYYLGESVDIYGLGIEVLSLIRPEDHASLFSYFERSKANSLVERSKLPTLKASYRIPDTLWEQETLLRHQISQLEKLLFEQGTSHSKNQRIDFQEKLINIRNQLDSLVSVFKESYPDYYRLRYAPSQLGLKDFQASMSRQEVVVEFFIGEDHLYTLSILKDTTYLIKKPLDFPLHEWVRDLRCSIFAAYSNENGACQACSETEYQDIFLTTAHQLYLEIIAPFDSLVPKNAKITIVPDGVLGYTPFDVLLTRPVPQNESPSDYPYLLREHALSYGYSATLNYEMSNKEHVRQPDDLFLAMAPSFDKTSATTADTSLLATRYIDTTLERNRLTPLAYNIPEAESIAQMMGGLAITDSLATEQSFLDHAGNHRILHLSTHGKVNDEAGDYSFLAFHHLPDSLENEWLYNSEIYNLELSADMVVLSACETGIGQLRKGEGIISLAHGFSYAGAKSVITSLWSVNDLSTKALMEEFYSNLKKGKPKDEAIRQAKLTIIEHYPDLGQHPFFWAAFIPIGDMSPIEYPNPNYWMWLVIGGIASFGLGVLFYKKSIIRA